MGRTQMEDEIMDPAVISALISTVASIGNSIYNNETSKKKEATNNLTNTGRLTQVPQYNFGSAAVSDEDLKDSEKVEKNKFAPSYNYGSAAVSDEELKHKRLAKLFGDNGALDAFSKIDAYVYNYNDKAKQLYGNERGVDNETHFGPMAQDLAKNPVTEGTVHTDPETGYLNVDTKQLTLTNTAMIAQMARKINELEERLGGR